MNRKVSSTFHEKDLDQYLYSTIPVRFQDIAPPEFEDFIAYLLSRNGYERVKASYSADFGADLIVKKEGKKTAIQVKRYFELHKVGVSDINQLIDAREYYRCDFAIFVTTSSFTNGALELALNQGIILWDWTTLDKVICDSFFQGKSYQDYFKSFLAEVPFSSRKLWSLNITGWEFSSGNLFVKLELSNENAEPRKVSCDLPILINKDRKQITAKSFTENSFVSGIIYSASSVEVYCVFSTDNSGNSESPHKVMLPLHVISDQEYILLENKFTSETDAFILIQRYYPHTKRYWKIFQDKFINKGRSQGKIKFAGLWSFLLKNPHLDYFVKPLLSSALNRNIFKTIREE